MKEFTGVVARVESLRGRNSAFEPREARRQVNGLFESPLAQSFSSSYSVDSHAFILKLAQQYQKLYVQLLYEYKDNNQPFQSVHKEIAKRLKKRDNLVEHLGNHSSKNIFGLDNSCAVWRKVK